MIYVKTLIGVFLLMRRTTLNSNYCDGTLKCQWVSLSRLFRYSYDSEGANFLCKNFEDLEACLEKPRSFFRNTLLHRHGLPVSAMLDHSLLQIRLASMSDACNFSGSSSVEPAIGFCF